MRIFCRSSGMAKIALILDIRASLTRRGAFRGLLELARAHLVAFRLLGRRDDRGGYALAGDFFCCRLAEVMGPDHESLGHFATAKHPHAGGMALGQADP